VAVDKQRVGYVTGDYGGTVRVVKCDFMGVVHEVNASTAREIRWLYYPECFRAVFASCLREVREKITKLFWQDEGIRYKVKVLFPVLGLHLDYVLTQFVLSGNLIARRKMIDLLMLIEALIDICLATTITPEHIPIMRLCIEAAACLQH
jgi:hypothetical protein